MGSEASKVMGCEPRLELDEQEETFFVVDNDLLDMFKSALEDEIPAVFFERIWIFNPKDQHLADLFVIVKMTEFFHKEREFMMQLEEHCQVETKKQIKSSDRPDFIKYKNHYQIAEDLFNKKGSHLFEKFKTGLTLEEVSGDTIETNNSEAFIKRRVQDAYRKTEEFQSYLKSLTTKFFSNKADLVVNSKEEARVIEKVREMEMIPEKYQAPVENYLYDLLRAQIRLNPEDLHSKVSSDTISKIVQLLNSFVDEDKFIRVKNKLSELGQISCNFIYEKNIVELQIVFAKSMDTLKQSHIVYDLERLQDLTAVRTYLMKKKSNHAMSRLFVRLGMLAFDDQLKECDKPGSLVFSHFIYHVFSYPDSTTFPKFPQNNPYICKGFKGKMILNFEKNIYEGKRVRARLNDGSEIDGDWSNFVPISQEKDKQADPNKEKDEEWRAERSRKIQMALTRNSALLRYDRNRVASMAEGWLKIAHTRAKDAYEEWKKARSHKMQMALTRNSALLRYDRNRVASMAEGWLRIAHKRTIT